MSADASLQEVPLPGAGAVLGAALEEEALPEQGLRGPPALPAPQGAAQEVAIQEVRAAGSGGLRPQCEYGETRRHWQHWRCVPLSTIS